MKTHHIVALILFLSLKISGISAQGFTTFKGKVVDFQSKKPLANTYIGIPAKGMGAVTIGTLSNENGEFQLKFPTIIQTNTLVATTFGYKDFHQKIIDLIPRKDSLIIELTAVENKVIEERDARKSIDFAISRMEKNYAVNPYMITGFYREFLTQNEEYIKISEGVIKVEKTPYPAKGETGETAKLLRGRSYAKTAQVDSLEGFSFGNGTSFVTRSLETKLPDFLEKNSLKDYTFKLQPELIEYDGMPVFTINFSPNNKKIKGSKQGKILMDTLNMAILKLEYEFTPEGLKDAIQNKLFDGDGMENTEVQRFRVSYNYRACFGNYYLQNSDLQIDAIIKAAKKDTVGKSISLRLEFFANEINLRQGTPIKENEIMEDTDFPSGGKKYEDIIWGNFNFIKPTQRMRAIVGN
jgi:hypothetical protein